MKEMSATEVARSFSAVLDGAEHGEAVAITRGGRRIAMLVPAPRANGDVLRAVLRRWQGQMPIDDAFEADVSAVRDAPGGVDSDPWHD